MLCRRSLDGTCQSLFALELNLSKVNQLMKKFIISGLLAFHSLLLLAPVTAQETQPTQTVQDCATTLIEVRDSLEQGRDVSVLEIRRSDVSTNYADYPAGRPISYRFKLSGSAAADIMNSSRLMTTLSQEIIESCDTVSKVTFGVDQTDWESTYGLLGQGRVEGFRCVEAGRGQSSSLAWGYKFCL
jgi:hypothetical protein